jgi:cytochrome c oxidase cbb3-type subunit 3
MAAVGPIPGPGNPAPDPPNPYAGDRNGMTEGHQLYNRFNCAGCHGDHGGGGMGPSLRDVDWLYGASHAQVFLSIAQGRAHGMPAWGTKLNDDQIWKMVAFIKAFRTRDEISPPS